MNWPTHTDYQDAIQNPAICFTEEDLKAGEAAQDMLGLPRVTSGNFASVYELATGGVRWAIRCFVRQVSGQQGRYARLSHHLSAISIPWLVKFEFIQKGILVRGDWFPLVKMEWVEGSPLNTWLDDHLDQPEAIRKLAVHFRSMLKDLRHHKIAHGDLQHGNIMVTPAGEPRLVDYDGMYCPAFGKGRSPELGHANFQHPRRLAENYDESTDNFSALVIYTSLLALASEPKLWKELYQVDNLLLLAAEYRNPVESKALKRLQASPDPKVVLLAKLIQQTCLHGVELVPWFEETIVALDEGKLVVRTDDQPAAPFEPTPGQPISWLDDEDMPKPEMSRPAPPLQPEVSRPAPPASRPAPVTAKQVEKTRPSAQTAPQPKPKTQPAPPQAEVKVPEPVEKGLPVWIWAVAAGIILLIILAIMNKK